MGVIYLLHYERPIASQKTQHYRGWTKSIDSGRLEMHAKGRGARLPAAFAREGIGFVVARTWKGDRNRERQLKNSGSATRQCPICHPFARKVTQ